jgi:hypothetical protein
LAEPERLIFACGKNLRFSQGEIPSIREALKKLADRAKQEAKKRGIRPQKGKSRRKGFQGFLASGSNRLFPS